MSPSEIAKSYDEIAQIWNGGQFPRDNGIHQHERAIAFVKNRGHAIDIGCGSSGRVADLLISHGFEVEGLDISGEMIKMATRRHPNIKFHHEDICTWTFPNAYDFISAWDSIWHVPLREHGRVLGKILRGLTSGGICIFTAGGLDAPAEKIDSEMGPRMYYSTLGVPNILKVLSETGCICRHLEYDQYPESHLYIIAQKA